MTDLTVTNDGSLFLLRPDSDAGRQWIEEHLPEDAPTWCDAVVVEHRFIADIVAGAAADGLEISPD
jgi:hypothetical protein